MVLKNKDYMATTKKTTYILIPAGGGDELIFDHFEDEKLKGNGEKIDDLTFTEKYQDFKAIQNFRIVLGKSREYLVKICENSNYKKLLQKTLDVAKDELDFGNKPSMQRDVTLDEKISNKKSISPKPTYKK
jgi:hypothetical protein